VAKTTLTFLERSRRKVKVKVDSFYSFLLSPETETQRHGTTTMEEVAGVSKRIGIGLELELELDWNCSFSSPSHDEGSRASRKQEGTNETRRDEPRRDEKRRDEKRRDETSNSIDENLHYLFGIKHCSSYSMSKTVAKQKLNRVKASKRQPHQIETATIQVDIYGQ